MGSRLVVDRFLETASDTLKYILKYQDEMQVRYGGITYRQNREFSPILKMQGDQINNLQADLLNPIIKHPDFWGRAEGR